KKAPGGLTFGNKKVPLADLRKELERPVESGPGVSGSSDWLTFKGDAGRTGRAAGNPPAAEAVWQQTTGQKGTLQLWVENAIHQQKTRLQPITPGFFPVAVGDRLVYRTYAGIEVVELKTGKLLWDSPLNMGLDQLVSDLSLFAQVNPWLNTYLQQH